ncbi:Aste57867_23524 [Aphanomyces stellatus]|uniref:Aste57867_23524 protein n=1 Tax=Aphanomyces stellatus TaxID=120398 RepID=A0A485LNZ3_9STRA|nr:hypothetical protein As57867_023453 [Aphanomyces stellatus]VFU00169.1 Aste57867_23524 [Aphanomyces stellatus]
MEWLLWSVVEKGVTFAMLFSMCVVTSIVAQYCEYHFVRFAKQSSWVSESFKAQSTADQASAFYEAFVLLSMCVWGVVVVVVAVWELNSRSTLGIVYSCYTGGAFGLAHFFKQNYLVAPS